MNEINELLSNLCKEYNIPIIDNDRKIWFVSTNGGNNYNTFLNNKDIEVELRMPDPFIIKNHSKEEVLQLIYKAYPKIKPSQAGMIANQAIAFMKVIKPSDYVVIPDEGTRHISVGTIGTNDVTEKSIKPHLYSRSVSWMNEVSVDNDLYLASLLKGKTGLSDISQYSDVIYRNIYSCYICDKSVHFTFTKKTEESLNFNENLNIQALLQEIINNTVHLFTTNSIRNEVSIKSAVGSPGFMEFSIFLSRFQFCIPAVIMCCLLGLSKGKDGAVYSGVSGIITSVCNLINTLSARKLNSAEIKKTEAETNKLNAEAELIKTQAEKLKKEDSTDRGKDNFEYDILLDHYNVISVDEKEKTIKKIDKAANDLSHSLKKNGFTFKDNNDENDV